MAIPEEIKTISEEEEKREKRKEKKEEKEKIQRGKRIVYHTCVVYRDIEMPVVGANTSMARFFTAEDQKKN